MQAAEQEQQLMAVAMKSCQDQDETRERAMPEKLPGAWSNRRQQEPKPEWRQGQEGMTKAHLLPPLHEETCA